MSKIINVVTGLLEENCYLVYLDNKECIIVDPGDNFEKIEKTINDNNLIPRAIIITHGHYDHTDAVFQIKNYYKIPVFMNRKDEFFINGKFEVEYDAGDINIISGFDIKAFHTPGHSPGSTCFLVDGDKLLSGDTLFFGSIGRCDFDGGSLDEMKKSLEFIMNNFYDKIEILPGHGPSTTMANEKMFNPYLINIKKL